MTYSARKRAKMKTLVIHAPDYRIKDGAQSFESTFSSCLGDGYAISKNDAIILHPGSKVILLRNDRNKSRAEGTLVKLVPTTSKTPQGIRRYDVYFENPKVVLYKAERLNRFGVAVI